MAFPSTGTLSIGYGASQGAIAGSVFGPWGTAIGGAVGGLVGRVMGRKAKKYKKYMRMAAAVQREREQNAVQAQYIAQLRQARMARAGSMAGALTSGIETSSLSTSALSSIGSQAQYNVQYTANDRRLFQLYAQYMQRAGANIDTYKSLYTGLTVLPDLVSSGKKLYNSNFGGSVTPFEYQDIYTGDNT